MTKLEQVITASKDLRPRTKELYLQHVRTFLTFANKREWTPKLVIAWRNDMRTRKISPQSVNVALNALRFAAQQADCTFFTDKIERLPVRKKADDDEDGQALTWSEGKRLLKACAPVQVDLAAKDVRVRDFVLFDGIRHEVTRIEKKRAWLCFYNADKHSCGNYRRRDNVCVLPQVQGRDLRDTAIITLGLRTGMLRFSMCELRFDDILADDKLTFIKKGGEQHTIQLDKVTLQALTDWTAWLTAREVNDGYVFRALGRRRVDALAEVAIGDQLTPDGLYRILRERAKRAGFEDIRPHVFRKTFLAWAKKAGARPVQIEAVTGHKSDGIGDNDGVTVPPGEAANLLLPAWDESF